MSVKDITGRNPVKKKRGKPAAGDGPAPDADATAAPAASGVADGGNNGDSSRAGDRQAPARRKAPTDSTNAAFEEWLRGRRPRDFLAEQVRRSQTRSHRKKGVTAYGQAFRDSYFYPGRRKLVSKTYVGTYPRHASIPIFQDNILTANHEQFLETQKIKEDERRAETVRTEWCYGPQKLNYVELKKVSATYR